jgi:hypothetical protein
MSPADEARLQDMYRREHRSLLQYAREASPYAAGADRKVLDGVLRIATEEADALGLFARFLDAARVPLPYPGSYPVAFTDLNFVTVRSLLPKLVAEQKQDLAKLEADCDSLGDPPARTAVEKLAEIHCRHLAELEALG